MTDEERKEWERKILKPNGAPKQKWKYMQRYYHKGAFFQDESADNTAGTTGGDGILQLDYSAPTGEDKMDRTRLPKVMQVNCLKLPMPVRFTILRFTLKLMMT
nr:hypothetical protein [Tanacetum cinerariifolium]